MSKSKNDLRQVWLRLAYLFWRKRWKCEKFAGQRKEKMTTVYVPIWSEKLLSAFRWAKQRLWRGIRTSPLVKPPHFIIYTCFVGSFVRSGVAHVVYSMAIVTSRIIFRLFSWSKQSTCIWLISIKYCNYDESFFKYKNN